MTICVGWRTQSEVFLMADAAVTSNEPLGSPTTSFGEAHLDDAAEKVEERAHKVTCLGGAGLTFAGNASHAFAIPQAAYPLIQTGIDPAIFLIGAFPLSGRH